MAGLYTTARWLRLRRLKLQANPLREPCLARGEVTVAVAVGSKRTATISRPAFQSIRNKLSLQQRAAQSLKGEIRATTATLEQLAADLKRLERN
jgi:hypothetical protein